MRIVSHGERGQTLGESVLFFPIVILLMMGIIYASQYFVVGTRAQLTVRYGTSVANNATIYSVANIYAAIATGPQSAACVGAPVTVMSDGAPLPGPLSAPYWQPASASSTCNAQFSQGRGAQFLSLVVGSTQQTVVATANVLQPVGDFLSANSVTLGAATTASASFARTADPGTILCDSKEVRNRVFASLMVPSPAPTATAGPNPTPLPVSNAC